MSDAPGSLLEEFLEGSAQMARAVPVEGAGAIFDRELSLDELEAIVALMAIGDGPE